MYQHAVKIARVLEETKRENRVANLGKKKTEFKKRGPTGMNPMLFNMGRPQEKGKQTMAWQNKPLRITCCKHHIGLCTFETLRYYGLR